MKHIFDAPIARRGAVTAGLAAGLVSAILMVSAEPAATQDRGRVPPLSAAATDPDIWAVARGGQLYDDWMAVLDIDPPAGDNPAYPKVGKKAGPATWRCKECHGWDYMGEDGAYGRGAHYTGAKGLRRTAGMRVEEIEDLMTNETHAFAEKLIPAAALRKLALFLKKGQVGMDQYIDRETKKARGDPRRGASFFQSVCAICHGFDGSQMVSKSSTELAAFGDRGYLGSIASDNPYETLHKIRNGQPGVGMVALRVLNVQDQVDVLAYMQRLRKRRE